MTSYFELNWMTSICMFHMWMKGHSINYAHWHVIKENMTFGHIWDSQMVFFCGSFNALSKRYSGWMSFHIWNRQMAFHLNVFSWRFQSTTICKWLVTFGIEQMLSSLHGSFNALLKNNSGWMSFHISNRQNASFLCGSFHALSKYHYL